jgi:putative redox protein
MVGEANGSPGIVVDSSGEPYGTHSGPTSMELILIGLAGCTGMDVISIMAKKRQPLKSLRVKVEGERAEEHPRVYTKIHVTYIAYGEGIDEKALERSIELSETKYCSVSAMLRKTAEITSSFQIIADPAPTTPGELPGG